jgi:hypothetical protein
MVLDVDDTLCAHPARPSSSFIVDRSPSSASSPVLLSDQLASGGLNAI